MTVTERQQLAYVDAQAADARVNVELETDEGMILNIGPQHPATHGTLRIIAKLDGEQVVWADVGARLHAPGLREAAEVRTYPQVTTLVNRIDWLGSFANEVPFILAAEQLMDIEAPPRARYIRTILFEMARIANIVLFLGDLGVQLGAVTPAFYAFRDREHVLDQIEAVTGGRFHPNFDRIGGLKDDLPKGWIADTKAVMERIRTFCDEIEDAALRQRDLRGPHPRRRRDPARGGAVLRADRARTCGPRASTGTCAATATSAWPTTRSTGRSGPTPTATASPAAGCACRRPARRPRSSTSCCDGLPGGPIMAKVPRIIKVPEGEAYVATENPLGAMGYYVVSKGDLGPVPGQDPLGQLLQRVDRAVAAAGRVRARHHHDPGQPLLHPRGHRPVTGTMTTAIELAYWQQTILRSVGVLVAVLLPAGTLVYVFLFKMMSFMQSRLGPMEAGPYGSMQLLAEVGKWIQKEDIVPWRADRRLFALAPVRGGGVGLPHLRRRCRSAPTPGSPTSTSASSTSWRCRRSR